MRQPDGHDILRSQYIDAMINYRAGLTKIKPEPPPPYEVWREMQYRERAILYRLAIVGRNRKGPGHHFKKRERAY